ncbi:MAG: hypothetical protein C0596_16685 [Marinilabiliales bacterium]|nr:MAG: hypothetical protein C0596_16685 [Marinilabiliales bacterium]
MNYISLIFLFIISVFTFSSCSTDVDVNGEYQEIPVVYCVLDQSQDFQYVTVNKSFLGPVPASQMAQISDSLFFENVTVKLHEILNNNISRSWTFDEVDTIPKPEGYFANDKNIVYVGSPDLNAEATYRLEVIINGGEHTITAETELIYGVHIKVPNTYVPSIDITNYSADFPYQYYNGSNGKVFQMTVTFNYLEVIDGDTIEQMISIPWSQNKTYSTSEIASEVDGKFSVTAFYNLLIANIEPAESNVVRLVKMPNSVEFSLAAVYENYATYMDVTSPSSGIVQEKPSYTNLTGGYGLFASRFNTTVVKPLGGRTLDSISRGIYTSELGFAGRYDYYYQGWY